MTTNRPKVTVADLIRQRDAWRATLERDYQATSARLQGAYGRLLPDLERRINALTAVMAAHDPPLSVDQIRGLKGYQDLLAGIEADLDGFARAARDVSGTLADAATVAGGQSAVDMAAVQVGRFAGQLEAAWVRPDPAALRNLVDFVDGPAMKARIAQFGPKAAAQFGDTFLTLVAQGYGPRAITAKMQSWLLLPYGWADTQVRTAQIYSYRLANHANFAANSTIVPEWIWWAALDGRTCLSCIAQHGSRHPVTETLNDHHRGRCAPLPVVVGTTWADDVESGPDWFAAQTPAAQAAQMGPGLYGAFQDGSLDWSQLSHSYDDEVYGTMLRQATLGELGIARTG